MVVEGAPLRREEAAGVHREPVDVLRASQADRGEHDAQHPVSVPFGVGRAENRAPRHAEHDPPVDAEMGSEGFDIGEVMVHVDARPVDVVLARMRRAPTRRALIEQDGPVKHRVERAADPRRAPRPRAAMEVHDRNALRGAVLLPIQRVTTPHLERAAVERLKIPLDHTTSLVGHTAIIRDGIGDLFASLAH